MCVCVYETRTMKNSTCRHASFLLSFFFFRDFFPSSFFFYFSVCCCCFYFSRFCVLFPLHWNQWCYTPCWTLIILCMSVYFLIPVSMYISRAAKRKINKFLWHTRRLKLINGPGEKSLISVWYTTLREIFLLTLHQKVLSALCRAFKHKICPLQDVNLIQKHWWKIFRNIRPRWM